MSIENAVVLTSSNIQAIRTIVGAGQPVGFTLMEMRGNAVLTIGSSYTFFQLDGDGDLNFKDDDGDIRFISEKNVDMFSLALSASQHDIEHFLAEAMVKQKAKEAEKLIALRAKVDVLLSGNDGFAVGDAIEWKEGMKNVKLPNYGEPVVVVENLATPSMFKAEHGTQYFAAREDIVVATMKDGELCLYSMDSRRFKLFHA